MRGGAWGLTAALLILLLSACAGGESTPPATTEPTDETAAVAEPAATPTAESVQWEALEPTGSMELTYADQFSVDYYPGDLALITLAGGDRFLAVPQGTAVPEGLDEDITVIQTPVEQIYVASSSAVDLFLQIGALDHVAFTGTTAENWAIPEIAAAVENGDISYAGKYSAPDYEMILSSGCTLAVENTMIYHSPEIKEQLERLGISVLVERSSYESHPLGRMEWMRLYGLLTGHQQEADAFMEEQLAQLDQVLTGTDTGKTVAFFYFSSNGYANVRKPGDYVSKMIQLAGGTSAFAGLETEDNALSTMNLQMEQFYAMAKDADILIYNSTVEGELTSLADLLAKSPLLADFKAVQEGNVWCTNQNLYQQTSGGCAMILDFYAVISDQTEEDTLTFLHRLV